MKRLKSLQVKAEAYLEPKGASTMEPFCKCTIFTIEAPS